MCDPLLITRYSLVPSLLVALFLRLFHELADIVKRRVLPLERLPPRHRELLHAHGLHNKGEVRQYPPADLHFVLRGDSQRPAEPRHSLTKPSLLPTQNAKLGQRVDPLGRMSQPLVNLQRLSVPLFCPIEILSLLGDRAQLVVGNRDLRLNLRII